MEAISRVLNQTFNELRLEQHPDKTLIGRTERGFDFLGYHFEAAGQSIADKTIERFNDRFVRLYGKVLTTSYLTICQKMASMGAGWQEQVHR